tara:strand:- start:314 stop:922 length:609 start_codon:yes stop_codon:yes gene_type:complete
MDLYGIGASVNQANNSIMRGHANLGAQKQQAAEQINQAAKVDIGNVNTASAITGGVNALKGAQQATSFKSAATAIGAGEAMSKVSKGLGVIGAVGDFASGVVAEKSAGWKSENFGEKASTYGSQAGDLAVTAGELTGQPELVALGEGIKLASDVVNEVSSLFQSSSAKAAIKSKAAAAVKTATASYVAPVQQASTIVTGRTL